MSDQSPKQTMSQPSTEKTMSEQSPKQSKSEQADQTVRNKITEVLLPKDNASSPASALAKEEKLIDQIVRDLMDENVTTIVLTGKAGVGKTRMASKISERAKQVGICEISEAMQVGACEISEAKQVGTSETSEAMRAGKELAASEISKLGMQVGICFGTIWVFANPGDHRSHCVSIAHQLSILSTAEEWEDHSTVIDDENITVNDEKKATDDGTGKSGDDTAFKDDEKEASESSLMKGISDKLTKMRSDELEKLRFDMLQKLRFDMLQEVRSDMTVVLEKKKRLSAELEKIGFDELEKMIVEKNERLSYVQLEKMKSEIEKMIFEKNERLSALLEKMKSEKEREKMEAEMPVKSEIPEIEKEKMKSEIPEKEKDKMKSEISEKEKERMISKKLKMISKITERLGTWLGTCLVIVDGFPEEMKENEIMNYLKKILLLFRNDKVVFKFLITTRREVTEPETGSNKKVFKIERLSDDYSSSLLGKKVEEMGKKVQEKDQGHPGFETLYKEIAKNSKGSLPDIETLYKEIAKKSEGLPAIILMIAAALTHIEEHDFDSRVWMLKGALDEPESAGVNPLLGYVYDMLACTDMALMNCCWQSRQLFHKFGGINYEELIACWILEGYIGVNDQFDKAYEEGHCVLMKLIDRGILKLRVDGLVTMEGLALTVPDEHCHGCRTSSMGLACVPDDHCHGRGISRLGLASILEYGKELGIGRVAPGEGMIKTPYGPKSWNKVSTLLIDGSSFSGEVLDTMFLQPMKNLQVLAIFNPRFTSLPRFLSENTNLRLLVLRGCDQLDKIDQIKNHEGLIVLEISGASSLKNIPDDFFLKMKQLESLNLSAVPFQSLPSSLSKLTKLRRLILQECSELKTLPYLKEIPPNQKLKEIPPNQRLANLEVLDLSGSTSLKKITDKCLNLEKLQMLDLSQTQINHLPILKELKTLTRLILKNCKSITRLSKFDSLASLHNLGLSGSTTLKQIHHDDSFKNKGGLKVLDLSESGIDSLPSSFTNLSTLESFDLSGVSNLVKIPENTFVGMKCLRSLNLSNTKIEELPSSISNLENLRQLLLSNCPLKKLPKTGRLIRLEKLDLSNASSLVKFEDGSFDHLTKLCYLNFSNTQITSLPSIAKLEKLRQLLLQNCVHLSELPSLDALIQLEELDLSVKETENKSPQSSGEPLAEPSKETKAKSPVKETEKKPSDSSGPSTQPLKETEAKSPVKETEKKPSESSGEPLAEPLKETEAKSPVKETEKKPSESSGEPSAPVKETEKKPSESSGEPSAEHLKETEAAKSPAKETEKKSSESSRQPSKETEAKSVKEAENKSSGSSGEPLAEKKEVEAKFLENMVHLRLLNLSGAKLKIKIPLMSNLTSLTNLTELCLGGCILSDTVPSLKTYTKLKLLDLSMTDIQSLPLENLTNLRGLKLRGCTQLQQLPDLKSLKYLESLDLQETGVKEFPSGISELTHLKHLDLPHLKDLETLDWGTIKNLPEELNWDHCGIFKKRQNRPCMSLSGTEFFQYLKKNPKLWETCFTEFQFSVCALTKEGKDSRKEKKKDKGSIQEKKENKVSSPENKDDKASSQEKKEDKASSQEKKQDKSSSQEKKEDKASGQEKKEYKTSGQEKKEDKTSSEEKKKEDKTSNKEKKEDKASNKEKKEDKNSCKEKKEDKSRDICWHRVDPRFRKIYFETHCFPSPKDRYLEIIGFDEYPGGVEDVLMKAEYVSLIENDFVESLSNLGVDNLKAMKGCWLEMCNEMKTIFCREEAEVEMQKNLNILWASNLPELKSVYSGEMQHGSLLNLTELYLDCCPMLEVVFPSSQLPENLKILEVKFCDELKTLFMPTKVEEYEQRNLQKLHLMELPKLTSTGVLEGSNNKTRFPSLKVIKVRECPNLQYFGTVLELGGSVENSKIEEY